MDSQNDVRDFLRSRRAKVSPEQVNLVVGGHRRVPGLRREEVATLASVSVDYYARLERGERFPWLERMPLPKGSPYWLWRIR